MPVLPSLRSALCRLDRLIELEILRLRARYQLSLDEFRGLYITDQQVDSLIAELHGGMAPGAAVPGETDAPVAVASPELTSEPRWLRLAQEFQLSALEQDLVLLALAPELDLKYETLFAYLNNDVTRKWPTVDLAQRLLANIGATQAAVRGALLPDATLYRCGLLEAVASTAIAASRLHAGFCLHARAARFMLGLPTSGAGITPVQDSHDDAEVDGYARVLSTADPPVLLLHGEDEFARRAFAGKLAHRLGLPLRTVDLIQERRGPGGVVVAMQGVALEQRLEPGVILVQHVDGLLDAEQRLAAEHAELLAPLAPPLLIDCHEDGPWRALLGQRRVLKVAFATPSIDMRSSLWQRASQSLVTLQPGEYASLADRYALSADQIRDAAATARDLATLKGVAAVDLNLLHTAARMQSEVAIGALGQRVRSRHAWEDLVVAPGTLVRLKDLAAAVRMRRLVYGDWGFGARETAGTGIKALFVGPSGTGKTMAAGIIARELSLDLFRIDLASVVSKYIGETEKNLNRIFETARIGNAMLFFDEADALFGKRSEVKDAHDRYANIEVAYLLQKLEDHDGAVILASNLKRNIDDAFTRRLQYIVDFPQPDAAQREQLWRRMFPPATPLSADVDFPFLARQFELAGGDIRNVALEAAFMAASTSRCVGMRELVRSLARQMSKEGRIPSSSAFQGYLAFLRDDDVIRPVSA
jgi:hypothetical protein